MDTITAVYNIRNISNGNLYLGASTHLYKRWREHKTALRQNKHANSYFQNAWNKYTEKNFIFEIIETTSKKDVFIREKFWENIFKQQNIILYNIISCGLGGEVPSGECHGRAKLTMEQVKEIREKRLVDKVSRKALALKYNVSLGTIKQIMAGDVWKDKEYEHVKNNRTKLSYQQAENIRYLFFEQKMKQCDIAKLFNVCKNNISLICKNEIWVNGK